jgi:hypothetical protein
MTQHYTVPFSCYCLGFFSVPLGFVRTPHLWIPLLIRLTSFNIVVTAPGSRAPARVCLSGSITARSASVYPTYYSM